MIDKEAIEAALNAHAIWKKRLQDAIAEGKSEFKVDAVTKDNVCQFGQWLYNLSPDEMQKEDFKKVQLLHAEFHKVAGNILSLALAGKKEEALAKLDFKNEYSRIAGKLVLALRGWKDKI